MSFNALGDGKPDLQCEEVQIPIPSGGFLSGKWWGDKTSRPFVCLHGRLDNAGSFDRLIPLLSKEHSYLAIDLPGHGRSSWLPRGAFYHTYGFLQYLIIIMNYYKWKKISIIAHSMGAQFSNVFAALYREKIDIMISIEGLRNYVHEMKLFAFMLKNVTDRILIADERNQSGKEPPAYTFDELIELQVKASNESLTKETAKYILERNIKPSVKFPGKFYFSRDNRMKLQLDILVPENIAIELLKKIKCPHMVINASKVPIHDRRIYHEEAVEAIRDAPNFEYHLVDSKYHHIHLVEPEKIATKINDFIRKYRMEVKLSHL